MAVPGMPPKKFKTESQLARERERRRRRRRKKKLSTLAAGQDVPLVLPSESASEADLKAPANAKIAPQVAADELPLPADVPPQTEKIVEVEEPVQEEPLMAEPVKEDQAMPKVPARPETEEGIKPENEFKPEEVRSEDEAAWLPKEKPEPEEEPLAEEPLPPAELPPSESPESKNIFEQPVVSPQEEDHLEHETIAEKAKREEAKRLSQNLLAAGEPVLEELPQKQGILGKIFDLLARTVHGREQEEVKIVQPTSPPGEKGPGLLAKIFRLLIRLAVIAALAFGAFWLGSSLKIVDFFNGLFTPKSTLELVKGQNAQVVVDNEMLSSWGFLTAVDFGSNAGDQRDNNYDFFFNASYFGHLRDPQFFGETGVSAAVYYGFGKEVDYVKNRFIYYVSEIQKVHLANLVNVQNVMAGKVRRDEALDSYIQDTQTIFDEANTLRKEINVQIDDLKISVDSLNPDKDKYETDFFAALDEYKGDKAQLLLSSFVETSQKQVDLKAKLAALTKLESYYETDLLLMKTRLDAIRKNRDALISGVTVTEIPGVDLNLINKQ